MVRNHRIRPPRHRLVCVPVGEHGVAGPDGSDVLAAVRIVQEDTTVVAVSVDAVVVAGIVGVGNVNSRINDAKIESVPSAQCTIPLITHGI